jgi:putative SOS response-associated peptidase YedK
VPVNGFFEWQHVGKDKIPWYIYRADNEIMSLAGIYEYWTESNTGEIYSTFSIVTSEANDLMAEIHNSGRRMPVVLDPSKESSWINISSSVDDALSLLIPFPSEILRAHTISPLINSKTSDRNTPELIQPYNYHSENLLF